MKSKLYSGVETKTEALIDGNRVPYDGCSAKPLETAKEIYIKQYHMEYIGSGVQVWVDGVKQSEFKSIHHFFRKQKETV